MRRLTLQQTIDRLQAHYGKPAEPSLTDPWLLILWENVAYLVDDERRLAAFKTLKKSIGTTPRAILAAPISKLKAVTGHGIVPDQFAQKLRDCARLMVEEHPRGLKSVLGLPLEDALKVLMKFHGVGKPGAEKILLFARAHKSIALESNGLRVLIRLGYAPEHKNYAKTYRLVQEAVQPEIKDDFDWLIATHQLLRTHGQSLCRRSQPDCRQCPLADFCPRVGVSPAI